MQDFIRSLPKEERLTLELSRLYEQYGYSKYRVAKFEDYSFYSDNRDFLMSDRVITFTDSDGKLKALKPDITLSLVRGADLHAEENTRLYYNEQVYRTPKGGGDYREIRQMGLEHLGEITAYREAEVLSLALDSLAKIDDHFYLVLSHVDLLTAVLAECGQSGAVTEELVGCISAKNMHDLRRICERHAIAPDVCEKLCTLLSYSGKPGKVLQALSSLKLNETERAACDHLTRLTELLAVNPLAADHLILDPTVIGNTRYYNGILFCGYVEKVPAAVLSGGRYDRLAGSIRPGLCAVGFAVYLDDLNLYYPVTPDRSRQLVILCETAAEDETLARRVRALVEKGYCVQICRKLPAHLHGVTVLHHPASKEDPTC